MQFYEKNLKIIELRVHILPSSEVTLEIGYNTFKSLMLVKAIHEMLHVEYYRASFWTVLFLVYVNDLLTSSKLLNPTRFADATNFSHKY